MKPITILSRIIALILIAFFVLLLSSCYKQEDVKTSNKIPYTFFVTPVNHSQKMQGVVHYGVNHLSESSTVNANGFGTSVELAPGQSLVVSVDAPVQCEVFVEVSGVSSRYALINGEALNFKR